MTFGTVMVEETRDASLPRVAATALAFGIGGASGLGIERGCWRIFASARHGQPDQ